jgi:hypothetical protein
MEENLSRFGLAIYSKHLRVLFPSKKNEELILNNLFIQMTYLRPLIDLKLPDDEIAFQYSAGLIDTDGSIQYISLQITQAEKGINALLFMYETFGGVIGPHLHETEKRQNSYQWRLTGIIPIQMFLAKIVKYMTVKKREAEIIINLPSTHIQVIPLLVTNTITNVTKELPSLRAVAQWLNYKRFDLDQDAHCKLERNGVTYLIKRKYTKEQIQAIAKTKQQMCAKLVEYHHKAHDPIPNDFIMTIPYLAGVIDGDGCLDTHGKSLQHHSVKQRCEPLVKALSSQFGGVHYKRPDNVWEWSIYHQDESDKILEQIAPYLKGKSKQAEIILAMAPGEASQVHAKLRELKGNINRPTVRIDATINNEPEKFKTPPKVLPVGVYQNKCNERYYSKIRVNKIEYNLCHNVGIEKAQEIYKKYKKLALKERRTGEMQVDWAQFTKTKTLPKYRLPFPDKSIKIPHVYPTASHTYQVKFVKNKVKHCVGTYETIEAAIQARDKYAQENELTV